MDALLVLAIDASGSQSDETLMLQREGHALAVEHADFLRAVRSGVLGRVALAAVEWSSLDRQALAVPWTLVEDAMTARAFARTLRQASRPIPGYTSITGAIGFSATLLSQAPYNAAARVIDISGNGPNNDGAPPHAARDDAVAMGIIINGLPILDAVADLDEYYARNVIGGHRAFMIVARDARAFREAVLRKLLNEIAAVPGSRRAFA